MTRRSKSNWKPAAQRRAARAPRRQPRADFARHLDWFIAAGLVLLAAVVYLQVLGFEFTNYDDPAYVRDNTHVRDGFSLRGLGWACTTFETANWYPLTWLSLMLDCQLFGPRPGGHHAVNALLHAADAVLLFVVLRRMTGRRWPCAAVAALFAIHPLHVESVAWIAERKDVLSTLFFLLALLAYQRYAARSTEKGTVPICRNGPKAGTVLAWSSHKWGLSPFPCLVFVSMALGLLCKSMLVTLPLVLLLLDYWPLGRTRPSAMHGKGDSPHLPERPRGCFAQMGTVPFSVLVLEKIPLLALSAAVAVVTIAAQASQGATAMLGGQTTLPLRMANAAIAYAKYLAMTVWPDHLAVFYPYDFHPRPALVVASIALLAGVTAVVLWLVRRAPYLAVGWFWYLGTLVPTIGLVQVGAQALADRYTYIPSIGLFMAAAWAVAGTEKGTVPICATTMQARCPPPGRSGKWGLSPFPCAVAMIFAAVAAVLLVVAHRQTGYWANSERLFRQALAVTGDNPESCENLGDALLHRDRYAEAEAEFRKVLARDAEHFHQTPGELAQALAGQRRIGEALALVHGSIPDDMERAKAMNELALFLAPRRYYVEAIRLWQEAIELAPKQPALAKNLAWIYATCPDHHFRDGPKAVELARRACELTDWSDAQYRAALADAYLEVGDREQAIEQLRAAQRLSPKDAALAARLKALVRQP
jgi:tetratricopeptide (TPR) repeat protein